MCKTFFVGSKLKKLYPNTVYKTETDQQNRTTFIATIANIYSYLTIRPAPTGPSTGTWHASALGKGWTSTS
jgi:hypothetical protein